MNSNKKTISSGDETFQVLLSTLKDVAITMTARQEVKDFRFSFSEKVGLEVELSSNRVRLSSSLFRPIIYRLSDYSILFYFFFFHFSCLQLICCQVYPGTQAEGHLKALDGAEILAVNGRRVL